MSTSREIFVCDDPLFLSAIEKKIFSTDGVFVDYSWTKSNRTGLSSRAAMLDIVEWMIIYCRNRPEKELFPSRTSIAYKLLSGLGLITLTFTVKRKGDDVIFSLEEYYKSFFHAASAKTRIEARKELHNVCADLLNLNAVIKRTDAIKQVLNLRS